VITKAVEGVLGVPGPLVADVGRIVEPVGITETGIAVTAQGMVVDPLPQ